MTKLDAPSTVNILDRLAVSRWDINLFAALLGVQAHPGQQKFFTELIRRDETRFRPYWLNLCVSAGNRAGKTLMLAIALAHHTIHKMGLRPPDPRNDTEVENWVKAGYHWYHFGIQQEVSELVYVDMAKLLTGTHEAQKGRGCPLINELGEIAELGVKERGEYRWVKFSPILGGGEIHFRTTNEKALGSLGKSVNGISFDECGFESNLTFVVNEVLHFRRLDAGGPLLMTSTPSEGFTSFADEWERGNPDNPLQEPDHLSLRMSTRDNVGYGIDKRMFDRLIRGYPSRLIPQNIDGQFIEGSKAFFNSEAVDAAFMDELPEQMLPLPGKQYVMGIDPALVYDATWTIVLLMEKNTGIGVYAQRREGKQTLLSVVSMLHMAHTTYNTEGAQCVTGMDTTGMGGKVMRDALSGIEGLRSVEFGGTRNRKVKLLTDLKGLIEQGRLKFPRSGIWLDLRRQLLGYRYGAIEEKKLKTDAVMSLAVAAKMMLSRPEGASAEGVPFAYFGSDGPSEDVAEGYSAAKPTAIDMLLARRRNVTRTKAFNA